MYCTFAQWELAANLIITFYSPRLNDANHCKNVCGNFYQIHKKVKSLKRPGRYPQCNGNILARNLHVLWSPSCSLQRWQRKILWFPKILEGIKAMLCNKIFHLLVGLYLENWNDPIFFSIKNKKRMKAILVHVLIRYIMSISFCKKEEKILLVILDIL